MVATTPVLNNGDLSIDLLDNGIAATFDHNDTGGLGLFIRTGSDLYLLVDADKPALDIMVMVMD